MNERHQGRKRAGVIAAAGLTALIGTGVLASPASAHNPVWSPSCDSVSVDLTYYNASVSNTVEIKAGGTDILTATTFGSTFAKTLALPTHTGALQVEMIVKAGDDLNGAKGYSVDKTQTVQPCQTTPTPPPTTAPPTTPASPSPSASAAPTSSAPAAAPSPSTSTPGTRLAETGSSSATPVIAGVAAVVVLAGGGLVLVSRRRRAGSR